MCFVADTTKGKGDARWKQGFFLGKALTNDMVLVHCDGNRQDLCNLFTRTGAYGFVSNNCGTTMAYRRNNWKLDRSCWQS